MACKYFFCVCVFFPAKKNLTEVRQLFFKLKDEVFSNPKAGFVYNTKALERILQNVFGIQQCMKDKIKPK